MIKMRAGLAALTRLQRIMLRPRSMKSVRVARRLLLPMLHHLPLRIWIPMDNPPMVRLKTLHIRLHPTPVLSLPTEQARPLIHHRKILIPDQASLLCLLRMDIRHRIHTRAALLATAMKEGIMRLGTQGRAMKMIQNIHLCRQVWLILLQPQPRTPG